ncbi:MAG TPA: hypothetical protein QGF43_07315, partial [Acidimicrobiales bacterium]|nr:hypothetical protein [Acidimicrobiales bacterium]
MAMNHARIAAEALRFRLGTLSEPNHNGSPPVDTSEAGEILAACGDPGVDSALRMLGDTWRAAGLEPTTIDRPRTAGGTARLPTGRGGQVPDT